MKDRTERAQQAVRDAAAEFLSRAAGPQSLITVTHVRLSPDFSHATLYISVLPEEKGAAALGLLERNIRELKDHLDERLRLPRMPHIEFELERGDELPQ